MQNICPTTPHAQPLSHCTISKVIDHIEEGNLKGHIRSPALKCPSKREWDFPLESTALYGKTGKAVDRPEGAPEAWQPEGNWASLAPPASSEGKSCLLPLLPARRPRWNKEFLTNAGERAGSGQHLCLMLLTDGQAAQRHSRPTHPRQGGGQGNGPRASGLTALGASWRPSGSSRIIPVSLLLLGTPLWAACSCCSSPPPQLPSLGGPFPLPHSVAPFQKLCLFGTTRWMSGVASGRGTSSLGKESPTLLVIKLSEPPPPPGVRAGKGTKGPIARALPWQGRG